MPEDSRLVTYPHIVRVQQLLARAIAGLHTRQLDHDASKLRDPEKAGFDEWAPRLKELEYGSPGYKAALEEMHPFLQHHYELNSHHPEHFGDGIRGMSLLDLIEMLCDWRAAGEQMGGTAAIRTSIEKNQARFGYSDELRQILLNTAIELGF